MTKIQIVLSWLLSKVAAPVVGATKISYIEDVIKAIPVRLTEDEREYLEEPYIPHKLVGVTAQNNK